VIRVAVVLDASALLSYADLRMAVPELIGMVAEEGAVVGIPAGAYTVAYAGADEDGRHRLVDLVTAVDRVVEIVAMSAADTLEAARIDGVFGMTGIGHAIIVARDLDAVLATYDVAAATRTLPTDQVLDLGYAGE
jgi:hypothetical protein